MSYHIPRRALALTTLALSLAACSGDKEKAAQQSQPLIVQESSDIPTLDPGTTYDTGSGQVVENLYETLVTYEGSDVQTLRPLLATSWEEGQDGREYRFTLRENVKFHSGNAMSCADAEYTFRRNLVTNTADSGNWFLSESLLGTPENAKNAPADVTWEKISAAVRCDGETLVFTLPKPDPTFLTKLAYSGQSIVDRAHAVEIGEWDGTEATWEAAVGVDLTDSPLSNDPSGTGAYKLIKREATNLTAEAFEDYWGEAPKIRNVIIQKVPEQAARIQAFLKGDAHLIESGGRPIIETQLKGQPGVTVLDDLPNTTASGIIMNQNIQGTVGSGKLDGKGIPANFFTDVDVRRGFVAAFDVPGYIRQVQMDKGKARNALLPDVFPGYAADLPAAEYNLDRAREAFQRAWNGEVWDKGFVLNIAYRTGSVPAQTAMEMLKKNIEALNPKFRVNIVGKEWSEIISGSNKGTEAMVIAGWAPDYADPDNFIHTFYASDGYYQTASGIKDEQLDTWIRQARETTDADERAALYRQVAERALDQAYFIVMPSSPTVIVHRDNLAGISADTYNPMVSFPAGVLWRQLSWTSGEE